MERTLTKYCRLLAGLVLSFLLLGITVQTQAQGEDPIHFLHFSTEEGLPSSYVKSLTQDSDGFIWAATRTAIVRFDGTTFREFPVFDEENKPVKVYSDKLFISSDSLLIARTLSGDYYWYDDIHECFYPYSILTALGPTNTIVPVEHGFWVCQSNQIFFLNQETGKREGLLQKLELYQVPESAHFLTILDQNGWIAFSTVERKIYSVRNKQLREYDLPEELNPDEYDLRYIDSRGNLWIHSNEYGLVNLNLENGHYSFYAAERFDEYHLPHNMVHCFAEDLLGRVWIGTESGLAIYDPNTDVLDLHKYKLSEPNGLNTDPIYDAFCDKQGNIWLGTYFGGINFWNGERSFFRTWTSGYGKWQLSGNVVSCLAEDLNGNIWIGMEDKGLNRLNPKTGEMQHYCAEEGPIRLTYDNLHDLLFVNDHELWIATYTGGINILNTETNKIKYYDKRNSDSTLSNITYQLYKLGDDIYIATSPGLVVFNLKTKKFRRLKPEQTGSLQFESIAQTGPVLWFSSSQKVFQYNTETDVLTPFELGEDGGYFNFVKTDSQGRVWMGTCHNGLYCWNQQTKELLHFDAENGFPAQWIFSMEEGDNGWIWVSSDKGLIKLHPESNKHFLYDNNSGIPFNQFNYRASFTDSQGNIYFGGNNGMVSFNESAQISETPQLPIAFTGFELFNKAVLPGELDCLSSSINKTDELVLKYNQNVFTIKFSAFNYASGGRYQYSYYLEGFEKDWNNVGNRNFATYTNLNPGKYIFRVKGTLEDGSQGKERQLSVTILPPFWLTTWAFLLYALVVAGIFVLVFRVGKNLEKTKARAELEHREKLHADELHQFKLEFFTNISHELKTPLTLILAPIRRLMKEEKMNPAFRKQLSGIERNANRLFLLINELLEFRKVEKGKDSLKVSPCDVSELMDSLSGSFSNLAEVKDIDFLLDFPEDARKAWIDINKIDKIVFNLLSNAFKFTPEGGNIRFSANLKNRVARTPDSGVDLVITVSDSGRGIKPEMLDKVFDRFFKMDDESTRNMGSGIGLAYVKSLVILHKGTITVDSIPNKGTIFTVVLPVGKEDFNSNEISIEPVQYLQTERLIELQPESKGKSESINTEALSSKPVVLLVEDNSELIDFLQSILEQKYQVVTAVNGRRALEKLETTTPELVISDVMMPEMDGMELTQHLKADLKFSHIPLILLTSKAGADTKLEGMRAGADYYLEKPFYPEILEQNIENILNTRKRLIERFKTDDSMLPEEMAHSESDKAFIEKLTAVIMDNISNPDLDVTFLLSEMGVSRSLLHLKLKSLVGCSSTEFIRAIRLKEAVKLISSGKCNISEAAYETGFSSPTYFTRRFREFYGKSPREYFNI